MGEKEPGAHITYYDSSVIKSLRLAINIEVGLHFINIYASNSEQVLKTSPICSHKVHKLFLTTWNLGDPDCTFRAEGCSSEEVVLVPYTSHPTIYWRCVVRNLELFFGIMDCCLYLYLDFCVVLNVMALQDVLVDESWTNVFFDDVHSMCLLSTCTEASLCGGVLGFHITGGRPIESDDPLWEIYVTLEGEGPEIVVTGFCTVYRFYHYPDSMRLRVSQVCHHNSWQIPDNGIIVSCSILELLVKNHKPFEPHAVFCNLRSFVACNMWLGPSQPWCLNIVVEVIVGSVWINAGSRCNGTKIKADLSYQYV